MKFLDKCPECGGEGNVPHTARALEQDELRSPNHLDTFKTIDVCGGCGGAGRRLVEHDVAEKNTVDNSCTS